jgi:hypothetical protein
MYSSILKRSLLSRPQRAKPAKHFICVVAFCGRKQQNAKQLQALVGTLSKPAQGRRIVAVLRRDAAMHYNAPKRFHTLMINVLSQNRTPFASNMRFQRPLKYGSAHMLFKFAV